VEDPVNPGRDRVGFLGVAVSSWQHRIACATAAIHIGDSKRPAGTGVLIEPDKILTCRHVVAGGQGQGEIKQRIRVRLPGLEPIPAIPEQLDWLGVDAVVLTLAEPVKLYPVVLSGSVRPPAKVELLGYPHADLTDDGVWRTFTVHAPTTTGQIQLDWADAGSFVGHSGGPVVDATTGRVVGLLRQGSERGHFDRYLPGVLARAGEPAASAP
jgi:hypothetical protein